MANLFANENINLHDMIICRAEDKISTELDGETVILDIASGVYSGLDPVGTTIWNLLEKPVSFVEIVQTIIANFDVSETQCTADLLEFLNSLDENKLIVVQDAKNS